MIIAAGIAGGLLLIAAVLSMISVRAEMLWTTEQPIRIWIQHPLLRLTVFLRPPKTLERFEGHVLGIPARVFEQRVRAALESEAEEKPSAPEEKPDEEEDETKPGRSLAESLDDIVPKVEPLVGPLLSFAVELPRRIRLRNAELAVTYGLGQPDWTGLVTGLLMTATAWWPPPLHVRAIPQWNRVDADVQTYLFVSTSLASLVWAAVLFVARATREWIDIRVRRVTQKRTTKVEANS